MRLARPIFAALMCATLATALACNKSAAHAPTDVKDTFSHACATDDDCAVVYFGGTCGFCNDSNGAIAKKDRDAYQRAYNAARENCPPEHAVGECAASYGVAQCNAAKTCTYVSCRSAPKDEHHCEGDGG